MDENHISNNLTVGRDQEEMKEKIKMDRTEKERMKENKCAV